MRFRKQTHNEPMVTITQAHYNELISLVVMAQLVSAIKPAIEEGIEQGISDAFGQADKS